MEKIVLEMNDICKSFGATQALDEIHFSLHEGEVHALLGENGAGKSTLIKVLGGVIQPDKGEIIIRGKKVSITNVEEAQRLGIGIIHQEIVLVPYLSITENIFLGREILTPLHTRDLRAMHSFAEEVTGKLGLNVDVTTPVGELSIAQQQMVEIVKAISFNVNILVMDEPTSSLSEEDVKVLFETIRKLQQQNVSIIYISHRMEELFEISQRITVIRDGKYVDTMVTSETTKDELVAKMVGRNLTNYYTRVYNDLANSDEVFRAEDIESEGIFSNVSFSVRKGEILGFAGLVGAGRSEIMLSIFGAIPISSGKMFLKGKPYNSTIPSKSIDKRIALVPEDRKKQGLVLINSVSFNITLASIGTYIKGLFINGREKNAVVEQLIKELNIKTQSSDTLVSSLSGGNQQKVVIAKWLNTFPELLILDEPTRGVDVGAKSEIYAIINMLAKEGMAIILVSSDLPEIINMCDNVCVVHEGKIVKQLAREELSQESIMQYATGGIVL